MRLQALTRQALGVDPALEDEWELLQSPETDLLPSVAARLEQASPRARGLRRYTWLRYQTLLSQARGIASLSPQDLLLADDLHLASSFYSHPSDRVLHGIDFVAPLGWDGEHKESLRTLGWQKPAWPDGPDRSEWVRADGTRLRFHWEWFQGSGVTLEPLRQRASVGDHGLTALSAPDQFQRSCLQAPGHLWMLDAAAMLARDPRLCELKSTPLACLAWRWNKLCRSWAGYDLGLRHPSRRGWTPAQWALALCHRRSDPYSALLGELALQLVCRGQFGWPGQWLRVLRQRWSLRSSLDIPGAYLRRRRGDFS